MKKRRKHRWNKLGQEEGERRTDLKINSIQCGEGRIDFCMHVGTGEKMAQKLDDLADCLFTLLSASLSLSLSLSQSVSFFLAFQLTFSGNILASSANILDHALSSYFYCLLINLRTYNRRLKYTHGRNK